ncbi:hypothetical protein A5892_04510 [Halotalea alkalilenta]|uniref:Uncharacterized protein n=1 Tax=Halotalea alkalilenta TaxID=376489 RepID=A0A172YC48_9GAMM|nr:hypothetical protein A5892_04510 [Halotalea alkalilenta]
MSLMDVISAIAAGQVPSAPSPKKQTEPLEAPSLPVVPSVPLVPSEQKEVEKDSGLQYSDSHPLPVSQGVAWIAERCPLLPEDRRHIDCGMQRVHPRTQGRLAEQYCEAWRGAFDAEPFAIRKDNAGRRAANLIVTRLLNGLDAR